MNLWKISLTTFLVLIAFAGNSLLCRAALHGNAIDPVSFTLVRLFSGAFILWIICAIQLKKSKIQGTWRGALALTLYASGFSLAYIKLAAGTGALLLFGMVQVTMIGWGLVKGESIKWGQWTGFLLAFAGLIYLLWPGIQAPDLKSSVYMLTAGIAWGIYSLLGRGPGNPTLNTAGNFARACPLVLILFLIPFDHNMSQTGVALAILSGSLASGLGYALWYLVLPQLRASTAATVQLSVPVLAAGGGMLLLKEAITWRYGLASAAILGGIFLFIQQAKKAPQQNNT